MCLSISEMIHDLKGALEPTVHYHDKEVFEIPKDGKFFDKLLTDYNKIKELEEVGRNLKG